MARVTAIYVQHGFGRVQDDAVGAGNVVKQAVHIAIVAQAEHPYGRVVQPSQALIGEIQVPVRSENQIVGRFEPFQVDTLQHRCNRAAVGLKLDDAFIIVGNENVPVAVNLESIWFSPVVS